MAEAAEVYLPPLQLSTPEPGSPFSAEGLLRNTVIHAVRQVVELTVDDPSGMGSIESTMLNTHEPGVESRYAAPGGAYEVWAARPRGNGWTRFGMTRPSYEPRLWIGLAAIARDRPLSRLSVDVIGNEAHPLLDAVDLNPGPAEEVDLEAGEVRQLEEIEEDLSNDLGMATLQLYSQPKFGNFPLQEGPGRKLVVSRRGAELPELARGVAFAYAQLLDRSGYARPDTTVARAQVARMLGVPDLEELQAAWNLGGRKIRLAAGARVVLKELELTR